VLNVGDGACSVVRQFDSGDNPPCRTAVIDCGSRAPGARSAADSLRRELSAADWGGLSELVVTHFDADHWEGFLRIVPQITHRVSSRVTLLFPAVPFYVDRRLPGSLMTFITATGPFGVQATELSAAWNGLTEFRFCPLARGDRFRLAGRLHEVVWPPSYLDKPGTRRLNRLVQDIEAEADVLDSLGYPQLKGSLLETYGSGSFNQYPRRSDVIDPDLEFQLLKADVRHQELPDTSPGAPGRAIPLDWPRRRPNFKRLVRRARAAQNDLSLVFHDPEHASLVVFGDAPYWVVERVSGELNSRGYQVALAPHHGSQELPGNAPRAEACISQHGPNLGRHWWHHKNSHSNGAGCARTIDDRIVRFLQ
jgi:hypothetical protein